MWRPEQDWTQTGNTLAGMSVKFTWGRTSGSLASRLKFRLLSSQVIKPKNAHAHYRKLWVARCFFLNWESVFRHKESTETHQRELRLEETAPDCWCEARILLTESLWHCKYIVTICPRGRVEPITEHRAGAHSECGAKHHRAHTHRHTFTHSHNLWISQRLHLA